MNFLRKLFGAKPAPVPPAPQTSAAPAPAPESTPEPAPSPVPVLPPSPPASSLPPPSVTTRFSVSAEPPGAAPEPLRPEQLETTLLTLDGPVWLPPDSPAVELLPAKSDHASVIAFLGGSAEVAPGESAEVPGRLSRAIPLYLAEQVEFGTEALTRTHVSWLIKPRPGFILGAKNWDDATASHHIRQAVADDPADYLVLTHLRCPDDRWTLELRLIRTIDAACLATASADCPAHGPGQALSRLTDEILALLAAHADTPAAPSASALSSASLPASALSPYLLLLDQVLSVRTAALPGAVETLRNEAEIIEDQLRLCRAQPDCVPARLGLAHTLRGLKQIRPAALPGFRDRVEALQKEQPLPEPAHGILARIIAEAFAG